jgi:hypothetical protein
LEPAERSEEQGHLGSRGYIAKYVANPTTRVDFLL